jgi:hypothetical protein
MQLNQSRLLDLFAQTLCRSPLTYRFGYARDSLRALRKNLLRRRFPFNCMDMASTHVKERSPARARQT